VPRQLGNEDRLIGRVPRDANAHGDSPKHAFPAHAPPYPKIAAILTSAMLAGGVVVDIGFRTRSHVALAATVDPDIIDSLG